MDPFNHKIQWVSDLGYRVMVLRLAAKMSQAELAQKAMVSRSTVARMERGDLNVTVNRIFAIAWALGRKPEDLFIKASEIKPPLPGICRYL